MNYSSTNLHDFANNEAFYLKVDMLAYILTSMQLTFTISIPICSQGCLMLTTV